MTMQIKHTISDPQEISLRRVIRWSWMVYWPATIVQLVFFGDLSNLAGVCAVGLAWFLATKVLMRPVVLNHFPFSTFLILGFTSTQFFFPLLFTTLEGRPIIYNLDLPEQVFFHSLAALTVLLVAHAFYRQLSKLTYNRSFSLMEKAGFFIPPTELQLWLMG